MGSLGSGMGFIMQKYGRENFIFLGNFIRFSSGGDKGSRTPDLLNAIETLYQLSYIPKRKTAHRISKDGSGRKRFFVENYACM